MEINEMRMDDIQARRAEIAELLKDENADVEALSAEVDQLEARANEIKESAEKREKALNSLAEDPTVNVVERMEEKNMPKTYTSASPEYRSAWLKNIAVRNGEYLLGEMNAEERSAFTFVTSNSGSVVPSVIVNRIVELVESMAPMYNDATQSGLEQGFGVPRHKSIDAGDAAVTAEGAANDDEQDTFDLLTLDGEEIKKHVKISRKMKFKSIDAFEDWIVTNLSQRIAVAKEKRIIARLDSTTYGIAAANVLTAQSYADAAIRSIFAKIRGTGAKAVYANAKTIWEGLAGITEDGKKIFVPDSMSDPLTVGRIYGAVIKEDNNLADNVAYFGIPSQILANDYDDLTINTFTDPTTFVEIVSAYSLFDAGLENPLSFVKVTFTA